MRKHLFILPLIFVLTLYSCKKLEYTSPFVEFIKMNLQTKGTISQPDIGIRYEGEEIPWKNNSLKILAGEGRFEFYLKSNNEVLLDTIINVIPSEDIFYLYQLDPRDIPVIIKDDTKSIPPPPEGFLKIRIANQAKVMFPEGFDVIFHLDLGKGWEPVYTIENVSSKLSDYHIFPKPANGQEYSLSFINSITKEPIKLRNGTAFLGTVGSMFNVGNSTIMSLYLNENARRCTSYSLVGTNGGCYTVDFMFLFKN
ncbi:hypothetical protein ACFRAE_12110 [Sphingobacterium sp. HJSM2_6]|uniref:hypothetical protein n=1 Tax=Sphingobacterium sp. HJSM2_6 TaxID=3366264 RepID=UPI003BE2D146